MVYKKGHTTMNIEVQKFLNDSAANFSESSPRPPVPGEENELASNGGTSTRSSGSHKSHLSAKSHTSSKSGRNDHSPAATPRRSNLEGKYAGLSGLRDGRDVEAPLGFEPEGSAANSPPFTENSSPPYLKWAENIHFLLEDSDGIKLFNQFLEQEQCSNQLSFYFACRGFKLVPPDDKLKATNLARLIYRKYIKGEALKLLPDTKREIADKIKQDVVDQHLLDCAQLEVYNSMQTDTYPVFLKSDLYVQYIQNGGESPKTTSNTSSGSNSVLPAVGPLPTLQEGEELRHEDLDTTQESSSSATLVLTQESLRATRYTRSAMPKRRPEGLFLQPSKRKVNPYHISYAPTSAQDSELQSLSSDALTDDTISLTDSSVDGRDSKRWNKPHRKAVHRARLNHSAEVNSHFIPRTERAPKGCNLAETDPKAFADMLIERLERVIKDRGNLDKVKETMHSLDMTEEEEMKVGDVSLAPTKGPNVSAIGNLGALMATAMAEQDEDNAQSILEEHVSRVWDNSAGQTPSRSPGRSPDRRRAAAQIMSAASSNISGPSLLSRSLPHHPPSHKRKDKDLHFSTSMLSFDSGVGGEDKSSAVHMDPESFRHHHHYHHHHKSSRPQFMEVDTPRRPLQYHASDSSVRDSNTSWDDSNRSRSKDTTKRLNAKKTSSDCNIDSGVSLYDTSPVQGPNLNLHDPTNEKVLAWMLENEKMGPGNTQYSTDNSDKSSSHKRSHKSGTNSTSRSSRKAQGQFHSSSRSASLDRSFQSVDYHSSHLQQVLPSQPFIQDPSMPLLNPPNPTTQLEEARRRLEEEKRRMMKSQSFTGATTKDRKNMPPPSYAPPRSLPLVAKSIPSANTSMDLSGADDGHSSSSSRSDRKSYSSKKPVSSSSAPTTPATSDVTVVGYYFCGEPIPYRSTVPGKTVTLAQFKSLITKKGIYKYFFKKASNEFDSGVILEEVTNDNDELPLWEGKVVGKVEKVE